MPRDPHWKEKLLMPLWALPMRCAGSTAHTQQVSLENGSPQRRFPSEIRRKHHVLLVWLQTPPDSHDGQEAKHKAKKAVWEVTTPKEKYYSISSLGRGSFPWYTPLLKRKKIFFPACTGLTLATVCYSALGDIHTKLSLLPHSTGLPSSTPNAPPDPREMLTRSSSLTLADRQMLGAGDSVFWGPLLLQSQATTCLSLDPLNPRFRPRPPNLSPWFRVSPLIQVSHRCWSSKSTIQKGPESFCGFSFPITGYNPSFFCAQICETHQMDGSGGVWAGAG